MQFTGTVRMGCSCAAQRECFGGESGMPEVDLVRRRMNMRRIGYVNSNAADKVEPLRAQKVAAY